MWRFGRVSASTSMTSAAATGSLAGTVSTMISASCPVLAFGQQRQITADRLRAGTLVRYEKKTYRVQASAKSQKGQGAASFTVRMVEMESGKKKEVSSIPPSFDFPEVRAQRVKLLFSGFDDDDNACFVFPQHSPQAGEEVNIPATSLSEQHQKFLAVGMPVDILHIPEDEETQQKEKWTELSIPTNYQFTVENLHMKGMYKMASLKECDGVVSVTDNIQPNDQIKVTIRHDGTSSFAGKA